MALVVEDGTGLTNADSYASEAFATTYLASIGADTAWDAATTADHEIALRVATQYLDVDVVWRGRKKTPEQALDWPRTGVKDDDDYAIDDESVPVAIQRATAEIAERYLADPTVLLPDGTTATSAIRRERNKADVFEEDIEYFTARREVTLFRKVEALIAPYSFGRNLQERA